MTRSNPISARRKLFLTGATGVVGRALLRQLPPDQVICLTHREPVSVRGMETVHGNIRKPRLGLTEDAFRALANRIGGIVHAAAITKFFQSAEKTFGANVDGTRHVLELAQAAGVPLYFVSTAFVHQFSNHAGAAESNAYEMSKRNAEEIIRSSGHPATIVRPSIIVGDSRTGEINQLQGFHMILDLVLRGHTPLVPGMSDSIIDFIPQDAVADFVLKLVRAGVENRDYWLTAGAQAPTLQHLLGLAVTNASQILGRPLTVPQLIRPEIFKRFVQSKRPTSQPAAKSITYKQLYPYIKYLSITEPLPTSFSILPYDLDKTFASNIRYLCTHNGDTEMAAARVRTA